MKLTLVFLHDKQLPVTLRWNNLSLCCHLVVTYLSFFGSYCYLPDFKLHINSVTTTLIHRNPLTNCLLYHQKNTLANLKRSVNIEVHDLLLAWPWHAYKSGPHDKSSSQVKGLWEAVDFWSASLLTNPWLRSGANQKPLTWEDDDKYSPTKCVTSQYPLTLIILTSLYLSITEQNASTRGKRP